MARIKYTCKNCGWNTTVTAQWADIKPKRCMNKKCNTSFTKDPKSLQVNDPTMNSKKVEASVKFSGKPNKLESMQEEEENGKASNKSKKRSKSKQQQTEEQASS